MKASARLCYVAALLLSLSRLSHAAAQAAPAPRSSAPPSKSREPSVRELVRMVLRAARHIDPDRIRALVRRARLAGLAPTLRLSGRRGLQQDLTSSSSTQAEKLAAAVADDLNFEAALSFDLSRLVFAPEEVRLLSVERWLAADQKRLLEEAIRLFFQRRRLLLERARNAGPDPELDSSIAELEALLDALTDGAFSRAL